jgi:ferredoxin
MPDLPIELGRTVALAKPGLQKLLDNLQQFGYETIGPTVRDHSIVYQPINTLEELPLGYKDLQDAGKYHLRYLGHANYFDFIPGAHTWKQYFFPPRSHLLTFKRDETNPRRWTIVNDNELAPRYALIGVRPCELAAIEIQDSVFIRSDLKDPIYLARRQAAFILAVNCCQPGGTCFCASLGTGPKAASGYDLCLTELDDVFLIEVGSESGRMALAGVPWQLASAFWLQTAQRNLEQATQNMGRRLPNPSQIASRLLEDLDHPQYDDVAQRCLSCANCTQVCPTCFCWDAQDMNDLGNKVSSRERVWDSCFNPEYSYVVGGNTRPVTRSRYRQWITHKLAGWYRQFGASGCVGCGRCITWCPAGIDITAEAALLCQEEHG